MKKRFIALLVAILMVTTPLLVFTGCEAKTETITSTKTEVGSYSIFRTEDAQEYLSFLENFDETKYQIVDISTSMFTSGYGSGEFYIVTYKKIAE